MKVTLHCFNIKKEKLQKANQKRKQMNVADYLAIHKYNLGVKPDPNNKIVLPLYHSRKNKTYGN